MSKRPLPASDAQVSDLLIFPLFLITVSHAAYIFLSGQLIFFCMLSLADYALSLIFVYRNPGSYFFLYAAFSGLRSFPYFYFLH